MRNLLQTRGGRVTLSVITAVVILVLLGVFGHLILASNNSDRPNITRLTVPPNSSSGNSGTSTTTTKPLQKTSTPTTTAPQAPQPGNVSIPKYVIAPNLPNTPQAVAAAVASLAYTYYYQLPLSDMTVPLQRLATPSLAQQIDSLWQGSRGANLLYNRTDNYVILQNAKMVVQNGAIQVYCLFTYYVNTTNSQTTAHVIIRMAMKKTTSGRWIATQFRQINTY